MPQAEVLIWISCVVMVLAISAADGLDIGVNWGDILSHPMHPNIVVQMLKDNGIKKVKLFDSDQRTVNALAGSGIQTILGIPNELLDRFNDYDNAKDYVAKNVSRHMYDGGVDIRFVAVGNEPFLKTYNGSYLKTTFPAMKNIQQALEEAGYGDKIKVVVPLNADVYESSNNKPSTGHFRSDLHNLLPDIVKFLHQKKSAFVVNIYPFLSLYQNENFPVNFAFVDGGGNPTNDNGVQYTNVFDANYDTLVWALKKVGIPDLRIIVGEIGWPTDGDKRATVELAHKFYGGLMKKLASKKGTPLRSQELEIYLFSLFDEDMKSIQPGNFERHWGIFRYDGKPKFPIDLAASGHEKYPIAAKGVKYLDKSWCVLDTSVTNMNLVDNSVSYACGLADCTPLGYGSSCNKLGRNGNASYAYNIYYQMQNQNDKACDFEGTATITDKDPSQNGCTFPIQIDSAGVKLNFVHVTSIVLFFIAMALM